MLALFKVIYNILLPICNHLSVAILSLLKFIKVETRCPSVTFKAKRISLDMYFIYDNNFKRVESITKLHVE